LNASADANTITPATIPTRGRGETMLDIPKRAKAIGCENLSRRTALQAGGALLGLSLPKLLAAEQAAVVRPGRARSVIFLFPFGGPSQLETFDLKPDAPEKIRGPFKPIASRTPGLLVGEHLPRTANVSDKFCVLKTMSHPYNDHSGGGHYVQTGHHWQVPIGGGFNTTRRDWPAIGSVVEALSQRGLLPRTSQLPNYVVVPNFLGRLQEYKVQLRRPGEYAGWLGGGCDPLTTAVDKRDAKDNPYWRDMTDDELTFAIQGLTRDETLTLDRLHGRRSLLDSFDDARRELDRSRAADAFDDFRQRALELVTSEETRAALDVRRETNAVRERYGRHLFGQSALVARRLVEAGTRFVTVHYDCVDGYSWDSHTHSNDVRDHLLPTLDQALSALLEDLDDRGLLAETLVICMGEMGRTPLANANWGRNHWSTLFPAVLAGAGIAGGRVLGETDRDAAYATSTPTAPEDLAATIYHLLGIDPDLRLPDPQGRPTPMIDGGRVLHEVIG
jgi:hypothetical protein